MRIHFKIFNKKIIEVHFKYNSSKFFYMCLENINFEIMFSTE